MAFACEFCYSFICSERCELIAPWSDASTSCSRHPSACFRVLDSVRASAAMWDHINNFQFPPARNTHTHTHIHNRLLPFSSALTAACCPSRRHARRGNTWCSRSVAVRLVHTHARTHTGTSTIPVDFRVGVGVRIRASQSSDPPPHTITCDEERATRRARVDDGVSVRFPVLAVQSAIRFRGANVAIAPYIVAPPSSVGLCRVPAARCSLFVDTHTLTHIHRHNNTHTHTTPARPSTNINYIRARRRPGTANTFSDTYSSVRTRIHYRAHCLRTDCDCVWICWKNSKWSVFDTHTHPRLPSLISARAQSSRSPFKCVKSDSGFVHVFLFLPPSPRSFVRCGGL